MVPERQPVMRIPSAAGLLLYVVLAKAIVMSLTPQKSAVIRTTCEPEKPGKGRSPPPAPLLTSVTLGLLMVTGAETALTPGIYTTPPPAAPAAVTAALMALISSVEPLTTAP